MASVEVFLMLYHLMHQMHSHLMHFISNSFLSNAFPSNGIPISQQANTVVWACT